MRGTAGRRAGVWIAVAIVLAAATQARASVAPGPTKAVSPPLSWTDGDGLARSSGFF